MVLSNFRDYKTQGSRHPTYAKVDLTKGFLWWKKTKTVDICKDAYTVFWFFVETGLFTPSIEVEELERSYLAKQNVTVKMEKK